jgi:hypothetical protein
MAYQAQNEDQLRRERDGQRKTITKGLRRMLTDSTT